jgi:hypothetical protein
MTTMTPNLPRELVELQQLVTEIEGQLLAFASPDARSEWGNFRQSCSSAASVSPRAMGRTTDDVSILVEKARRFRALLLLS